MTTEQIEKAKQALKDGTTRGRFIQENTSPKDGVEVCQQWSDAYTTAMQDAKGGQQ